MFKKDEVSRPDSCLSKARPEEMIFVLLARDAAAPAAIRAWIEARISLGKNHPADNQILEAESCARMMERQQQDPMRWRT
jgi:hypothetical protein